MADDEHQIGYQALPRGVPVHTSDGAPIGTVAKVLDNPRQHLFDGIVIDTPAARAFVDAPEVARITAGRVTLNIDAGEPAVLPPHQGKLGAMQIRAQRAGWRW